MANHTGNGYFKKGQVANPGGRPKLPADLIEACRLASRQGLEVAVEIMLDKKAKPEVRLTALQAIWDRGWGKPVQQVLQDTTLRKAPVALYPADMSPDELEQAIPKLLEVATEVKAQE